MQAVKFKASVKNGVIHIPKQYQKQLPGRVRIIIFPERKSTGEDMITRLLSNPLRILDFQPFSREEIYHHMR